MYDASKAAMFFSFGPTFVYVKSFNDIRAVVEPVVTLKEK